MGRIQRMRGVRRLIYLFIMAYASLINGTIWHYLRYKDDRASAGLDDSAKAFVLFVVIIVVVVIGGAIYFTITTPAGQSGLAGIGQGLANSIASPFIAIGNGIGSLISSIFSGLGNAISHLL